MKVIKILFNWMRKVSHMCSQLKYGCETCPFYTKQGESSCKIKNLCYSLCCNPSDWDVDEFERKWNR